MRRISRLRLSLRLAALAAATAAFVPGAAAAAPGAGAAAPARAATAAAAWAELPGGAIPRDRPADCLRTGAPGELAVLGPLGRATVATALLTAGERIAGSGTTTLGWVIDCPTVASAPGAATLYAAPVYDPATRRWQQRVGEAGAPPVVLRTRSHEGVYPPAVVVAPSGAAVVAWYEYGQDGRGDQSNRLLVAARPRAGAGFSSARVVATGTGGDRDISPALGIDGAGTVTLGWQTVERTGSARRSSHHALRVTTVAPDGTTGPAQTLTEDTDADGLALAVAPDGGALLATDGPLHALTLFERLPGASAFAPVPLPGQRTTGGELAVALASGGGAVVADRTEPDTVVAWLRPPGGGFSGPQLLAGRLDRESAGFWGVYLFEGRSRRPRAPFDSEHQALSAAIGAGGEVLVTWVDPPDARSADGARVARGTLASGFARPARVGGTCRMTNAIKPFPLLDGSLAVAWTDNARVRRTQQQYDAVSGGGRVHVASGGGASGGGVPAGAAPGGNPRARVAVVGAPALRLGQPLRLRVRCSDGPCDVRASVQAENPRPPRDPADPPRTRDDGYDDGSRDDDRALDEQYVPAGDFGVAPQRLTASTTLAAGASAVLRFAPDAGYRIGRLGTAAPAVRLTTCAPAGAATSRAVARPRVRQLPPRPYPWLRDLRVRRAGGRLHVSWRTAAPATRATFSLMAFSRADESDWPRRPASLRGRGRSRFAVSFRAPATTRRVRVLVSTRELGALDTAAVPVRAPAAGRASPRRTGSRRPARP